ncbi:Metallo-peptidase family M12B Reprolysin-like [Aquimarina amphilecti]|uniref:Metallo-peptidase family M12B Reprolysin-like n=1 Tax=Aquimarina amphilecti TaxID=1038014 RepID=A0A1H7H6P7_AQUAM|nr:zinc-dependent metalloprotease family protein [Aquimarina amphilecti]SEK45908.1 Metallo-peptidase family M12B Reprolysin-like [Aquimarina amphilecti]
MASLKSLLNCIGVDTNRNISVLRDVLGYTEGIVPADPSGVTATESLLEFMNDAKGNHFHINVIDVGLDNFSSNERYKVDYSIYRTRRIFRTVNLGLGRIERYVITSAEANGRDDIGSEGEATDLTQEWTVPNNGMDVFMVDNISADFVGISNINGPCDKDAKGRNGVIGGEVNRGSEFVAKTFAHEIAHYLGLSHNHGSNCPSSVSGQNNLMAQTRCRNNDVRDAVLLTVSQGNDMRDHCFVKNGC